MLLKDDNFEMQGGVRNYLGKTEEVKAPKYWKSSKDSPETELVYITEAEKGLLLDANLHGSLDNGKPNVGASGLLSLDGWGDRNSDGSSDTSGGNAGAEGGQGSGNSNDSYSGGNNNYTPPSPALPPGVIDKGNYVGDGEDIDSVYTDDSFTTDPTNTKSIGDKIMDYVKGGGMIGAAIRTIGGALGVAKENKYAGITGEDGYGEGDYISTQGDWAESKGFVDKAEDYYDLDLEEQQDIDKQMYDAGVRSQAFNDLYEGDTSNVNNLTSTERDAVNSIIPDMAYEVGGTTAQPSMVNDYFANLNNTNLGISENYLNTYNTAKSKMANTLNITPNTQQYGYGNSYNDTYSRSMNNTNVFYNYLNEQGLI